MGRSAFDFSGGGTYTFAAGTTNSAFADALNSGVGFQTYGIRDEALELATAGAPVPIASSLRGDPQISALLIER